MWYKRWVYIAVRTSALRAMWTVQRFHGWKTGVPPCLPSLSIPLPDSILGTVAISPRWNYYTTLTLSIWNDLMTPSCSRSKYSLHCELNLTCSSLVSPISELGWEISPSLHGLYGHVVALSPLCRFFFMQFYPLLGAQTSIASDVIEFHLVKLAASCRS